MHAAAAGPTNFAAPVGISAALHPDEDDSLMDALFTDAAIEKLTSEFSKSRPQKRTHANVSLDDSFVLPAPLSCGVDALASFDASCGTTDAFSSLKHNVSFAGMLGGSSLAKDIVSRASPAQVSHHQDLEYLWMHKSATEISSLEDTGTKATDLHSLLTCISHHHRPSDYLREIRPNKGGKNSYGSFREKSETLKNIDSGSNVQPPPFKIVKKLDSVLHRACQQSTVSVQEIEHLLRQDPTTASQSMALMRNKQVVEPTSLVVETKCVYEPYTYPLHIAIHNRANADVIKCLIRAAPSVLAVQDGPLCETPLFVLLKYSPAIELVDMMLLENPKSVFLKDRRDNTVLHIACQRGVSTAVLRHLCILYPKALSCTNFNGKTPFQIAQQQSVNTFSEEICTFLMNLQERK